MKQAFLSFASHTYTGNIINTVVYSTNVLVQEYQSVLGCSLYNQPYYTLSYQEYLAGNFKYWIDKCLNHSACELKSLVTSTFVECTR